jgi:hypothetical protein
MINFMLWRTSILIICLTFNIAGCGNGSSTQPQAMLNENLNCPVGSKGEYDRWGGVDSPGWAHSCKMNHGKYHVWKGGVLTIEGQFERGKKDGVWIFRDENGKAIKTVEYRSGVEVKKSD